MSVMQQLAWEEYRLEIALGFGTGAKPLHIFKEEFGHQLVVGGAH